MVPIRCGERRKGIGSVLSGRMVFIKREPANPPARDAPALGRGQDTAGSKRFQFNETAALPSKGKAAAIEIEQASENQLLRRPSAARFHCDTLSAIMRVDFIAAWLSWA